ncbi:unnamed protein product [Clavelina lepadiformis]|uniref:Uncharacterized protein n=1 Tax=Clavelina lepadiformis TaxID=159417 RepID=A0ABP0G9D5_CLALP
MMASGFIRLMLISMFVEYYLRSAHAEPPKTEETLEGESIRVNIIPPKNWLFTAPIVKISTNAYGVFGREIYISDVDVMLTNYIRKDGGDFPVQHSTASEAPYEVIIQADTLYLDERISWQGLKKLKILARRLISNKQELHLMAPSVCERIEINPEKRPGQPRYFCKWSFSPAMPGKTARSGKNGIPSCVIEIYVGRIEGDITILNQASDGIHGEPGKNGASGADGATQTKHPPCPLEGTPRCRVQGLPGDKGQNGGDGQKAGRSGTGGTGKKMTLIAGRVSGIVKMIRTAGNGGDGAKMGLGGAGGKGGIGGCSALCIGGLGFAFFDYYVPRGRGCGPNITSIDCTHRGPIGESGHWGRNGEDIYGPPQKGADGTLETSDVRIGNMKSWFSGENELLKLFYRRGEYSFLKNQTDEALDVFSFLMKVTEEGSSMHTKASMLKTALENGFDFYGNAKYYAPVSDWNYYSERSKNLLLTGKAFEDAFNNVKNKEIEVMMRNEHQEIRKLLPEVIEEKKKETTFDFLGLLSAITGFIFGAAGTDPGEVISSAISIAGIFSAEPRCKAPSIAAAQSTLQDGVKFAFQSANVDFHNFDLSDIDVKAIPIIMQSKLAKNKRKLFHEFSCLLDTTKESDKTIEDQLASIAEVQSALDTIIDSSINNIPMSIKVPFTDKIFNLYQQQEAEIMRSLYNLAKAYQFLSLWKFDALDNYMNVYGDRSMINNLDGTLTGIAHLQSIKNELEYKRKDFIKMLETSAGIGSNSYKLWRKFNKPSIFKTLNETGRFTINVELDPEDINNIGCDSCYNGRLVSMYVELTGSEQPASVPDNIYLKVAHMGNSYFLLPLSDGKKKSVYFQQKPQNVYGGNVMSFDRKNLMTSTNDDSLDEILHNPLGGNKFCRLEINSDKFYGGQMCRSPYATYTVTVPKTSTLSCDVARGITGTNCKDLDYSKFDEVRVYAYVRSFSSYPAPAGGSFIDS